MRVRVSMLFGVLREWENKAILSVFHLLSTRGKFLAFFSLNEYMYSNTSAFSLIKYYSYHYYHDNRKANLEDRGSSTARARGVLSRK